MKKYISIFVLLFSLSGFSQENYKYVIVPEKFQFLKTKNQYGLNALTKSFFETEGYTVFYDTDALPIDLANNRCKAMLVDAVESNKLFTTNVVVVIKDCQNKILIESFKGSSREKSYQVAYNEVFRTALTSLKGQLNFKVPISEGNKVSNADAVEQVEIEKAVNDAVEEVVKAVEEAVSEINQKEQIIATEKLFALPTETGYKLVDTVPNVIYILENTNNENVFTATKGNLKGVFTKKNDGWYFEYKHSNELIAQKVNVKF